MDELERELAEKIKEIKPVDQKAIEIAKKRWDSIRCTVWVFWRMPLLQLRVSRKHRRWCSTKNASLLSARTTALSHRA